LEKVEEEVNLDKNFRNNYYFNPLINSGDFFMEKIKLFEICLENKISTDTRDIKTSNVFIALKGDNFDGNKYCEKALELGASICISDNPDNEEIENVEIVPNSLKFLQELALHKRNKFNIPFIGITGSNGKTTNKELIHAILSKKYRTTATKGNLNNHIGVPFTILDITDDTEIAIIEMGANKTGDIKELSEIARPSHGLITNIGAAHLEGFINLEGVVKTKKELYDFIELEKSNTVVFNQSDEILNKIVPDINKFPFGENTDLIALNIKVDPFLSFSYQYKDYHSPILKTNLIGDYNVNNFLAAISFGIIFNVDFNLINEAITNYNPDNNRSQLTKTDKNSLILDCYNANPTSLNAAIQNFNNIETKSKLSIVGDMLELGAESIQEHQKIIDLIHSNRLDCFFVGNIFKSILKDQKNCFNTVDELISSVDLKSIENKMILLKGSRGIKLEKLIEHL
jgi:UDP-N-acetylmuramoyl-tripeptide--D-alanyl-D-alanine ligase